MEDILASIRRILNEEDVPSAHTATETPAEEDVLVLDQSMMVHGGEPVADPHSAIAKPEVLAQPEPEREPEKRIEIAAPPSEPEVFPPASALPPQPVANEPVASLAGLVGAEAAAAAALSVGSLVRTLSAGRATQVYSGGPTLEDLVRAELRPLLKEWLDTYLPPMVERLVRAEIERVVGRAVL
jgi:hypothetical protein